MTIDPRLIQRRRAVAEDRAKHDMGRLLKILAALIAVGTGVWVALSPWFSVSQVRSTGIAASDAYETMVRHGLVAGRPLVLIRSGVVEDALEADPWISEARVHLSWPDEVVVRVVERTPVAWVRTAGGWARRAIDGVALPSPSEPGPGLALVDLRSIPDDEAPTSPLVLGAVEFAAALGDGWGDPAMWLVGDELWVEVAGFEVRLGRPIEMAAKARSLGALLGEEIKPGSILILVAPTHPAVQPPLSEESGEAAQPDKEGTADLPDDEP